MAPDRCELCEHIHYESGAFTLSYTCEHPEAPRAEQLGIPLKRLRELACVVDTKGPPPWWCPRRQL